MLPPPGPVDKTLTDPAKDHPTAMSTSLAPPPSPPDPRRKLELEAAMRDAPGDGGVRDAYFEHLAGIAVTHTGLQTALLPELGVPLYFRGGTPDIAVLAKIFRDNALAFEMPGAPARILVLGAYVGYAAVALARRFPAADILAVEPLADNFRLLQLNTAMWPRIARRDAAVWHHPTRLAPTLRVQADWAVRLHDQEPDEYKTIAALGVEALLDEAGWPGADMLLCDASGAEREVFANPNADWLQWLDVALVALHEQLAPRASEWVDKALPADLFEHRTVGGMELYARRLPRGGPVPPPAALPLFRAEPGLTRFSLMDVPNAPFGFFVFDGGNCQLHPNPPGGKPARVLVTLPASGHRRFVAEVRHAGRAAPPIRFAAAVRRADGTLAGQSEATLTAREAADLRIDFAAPLTGPVSVLLQTAMDPRAADSNNAWAHWLDPKLV